MSMGATRVKDPRQLVFALDHDVQNKSESNLKKYEQIEAFAKEHGVVFFPAAYAIGHQVMVSVPMVRKADCRMLTPRQVEELFVWPGKLCVASDSHSNMYGGVSSLTQRPFSRPERVGSRFLPLRR